MNASPNRYKIAEIQLEDGTGQLNLDVFLEKQANAELYFLVKPGQSSDIPYISLEYTSESFWTEAEAIDYNSAEKIGNLIDRSLYEGYLTSNDRDDVLKAAIMKWMLPVIQNMHPSKLRNVDISKENQILVTKGQIFVLFTSDEVHPDVTLHCAQEQNRINALW